MYIKQVFGYFTSIKTQKLHKRVKTFALTTYKVQKSTQQRHFSAKIDAVRINRCKNLRTEL